MPTIHSARNLRPQRSRTLAPIRPNAGIEVAYRRKLQTLIDQMATSVVHWVKTVYRANEPVMALDAGLITTKAVQTPGGRRYQVLVDGKPLRSASGKPRLFKTDQAAMTAGFRAPIAPAPIVAAAARAPLPAAELQEAINALAVRWQGEFDKASTDLARYFATATRKRTDRALQAALDKSGITVNFRLTPAARDILKATVEQNVQLIRTIPQQYLAGVQGDVMRSVQTGRDIGQLAKSLQQKYGVTKRRAAFIARDQNAKATSAIQKARQLELGLNQGIWMHSSGGKEPRPTHVGNDGKVFDLATGWYDPDPKVRQRIMPGELPNCRCVWRAVIPGFD